MNQKKNEIFEDVVKLIKEKAKEMGKDFATYFADFQNSLNELGGWSGLFNYALYVEEKKCEVISFKECVEWVKSNLKPELHTGAIISKKSDLNSDSKLTIKICFIGKDGQPLPDNSSRHLIIRCNSIDDELKNYFAEKDTIVLK